MAIIALFCDGTWARFDSAARTHVARLADGCSKTETQIVRYFDGVGTGTSRTSRVGLWISKIGGGLFGWGLNRNIRAAYLELCKLYQPGDKIMVFGFSRGAYTARSLVGMIRKCGILAEPTPRNVRTAFRLYRRRGAHYAPDTPHVWAARRQLSPHFATSPVDVMRRGDDSYLVRIAYLGIWDTVGALGIPESVFGRAVRLWNARYRFHDTVLSRLVEQARHVVALDERRVMYAPSLWSNLEPSTGDPGLNDGDRSDERPYQQKWFAGAHGLVGGSAGPAPLSSASLEWIVAGAAEAGLQLDPEKEPLLAHVSATVPSQPLERVRRLYLLAPWLIRWREGPERPHQLHESARLRAALVPGYRPLSLRRVLPGLFRI